MSLTIAIFGLAFLVLIHEAGHFVAARLVGMRPRKFYLGFGPPLVKTTRGGVEYGIAAFPLGGYVKIPGMNKPSPGDLRRTLLPAQAAELEPQLDGLDEAIERGDDQSARAWLGEMNAAIGTSRAYQELDGSLAEDAYWRQKTWKRIVVIAAGPGTNILLAIVLFAALFMVATTKATRNVEAVLPGKPAVAAGLKAGDKILAIGGVNVAPDQIAPHINATHGRPFRIVVERGAKRVVIGPVRAKLDQGVYRIGFEIQGANGPGESVPRALWSSLTLVGQVTTGTAQSIGDLAHGKNTRNISSAVGIVRVASSAFRQSVQDFLGVLGLISMALALLNLLPILPLDGGHIVMAIAEKIRGRTFSQAVYLRYSAIGLSLFVFLMYLGLRNDLFGGGG
jgi:regulator of sigma E protease